MTEKLIEVLLIEDNRGDALLIHEAFSEIGAPMHIHTVTSGEQAMAYLEGLYLNSPTPDLILLDLNLPGKDGRQIFAEIKRDKRFNRIPLVIITSSSADQDILQEFDSQMNFYITKPLRFKAYVDVADRIQDFLRNAQAASAAQLPG